MTAEKYNPIALPISAVVVYLQSDAPMSNMNVSIDDAIV